MKRPLGTRPGARPGRTEAEAAASRLSHAVAGGDAVRAAAALEALAQTLETARQGTTAADARHQDGATAARPDPARGLNPARNPAFAQARRRRDRGAVWTRAAIGIALAGAVAWWFAAHAPRHHDAEVAASTAGEAAPNAPAETHAAPDVQAAEAEILESQVMVLAAEMPAPAMPATVVAPRAPAVAEQATAPPGAAATPEPPAGFSSIGGLITQWQNEQAQLAAAERSLAAGRTAEARRLIEAVQTQIVLQPVTPGNPRPARDNNGTAAQLGRTLQLLDSGEEELARRTLQHAIEILRSTFPTTGPPSAG